MNLDQKTINLSKDFLINKLSPSLILIFGSASSGNFRAESDLDIAFLTETEIDSYQVYQIAQELSSLVGRDIDLVDLQETSTVFRAQIVGKGVTIFAKNNNFENEFKVRTLKDYALLNEERAPILKRIKEEGDIYG
jgi:predicted nucleotidyltransferase